MCMRRDLHEEQMAYEDLLTYTDNLCKLISAMCTQYASDTGKMEIDNEISMVIRQDSRIPMEHLGADVHTDFDEETGDLIVFVALDEAHSA